MINKQYFEIQELVEAIIDNRGKTVPTSENGIPLIATNCIKHSSIFPTFENIRYINQETYDNWFRAHLKPNDILFVNKGTPGRCCIVPNPVNFVAAQDMVGLRFKKHLNPYYILAVLRSKEIQNTIENNHVGLVIAHFRKQELVKLKLPILEETIRNKIGDFYEIISKKIELNNRINAELEAMAKTLYDYWFVQFDFPVASTGSATEISGENVASTPLSQQSDEKNTIAERSQESVAERSRGYKSSGGKMVYNEILKREIPEGWEVKSLSGLVDFTRGISYTSSTINDNEGIPMINLKSFNLNGTYRIDGLKYFTGKLNENKIINKNDLLIAITDVTREAEIIGKAILSPDFGNKTVCSCDVARIDILKNSFSKNYLRYLFNSNHYHNYIKHFASGTLVLHLDLNGILWYKDIIPPINLQNKFEDVVNEIDEKITNNLKQNQELSALRDWLLPMLMNGQVKVG